MFDVMLAATAMVALKMVALKVVALKVVVELKVDPLEPPAGPEFSTEFPIT